MPTAVSRFRFAPTPTTHLHVGDLHTALFNWAAARALGGDFILRFDDADASGNPADHLPAILEGLTWLGLDWDEGPDVGGEQGDYIQSSRHAQHQAFAEQLLTAGQAYADPTAAIRLKHPAEPMSVSDGLRGTLSLASNDNADPLIRLSNGRFTPHFAAVCDDYTMGITHVMRSATEMAISFSQASIYRAFGWPEPIWLHLPPLLTADGVAFAAHQPAPGYGWRDLQQAGYSPPAIFTYLLQLGWTPPTMPPLLDKWRVRQQFQLAHLDPEPVRFVWAELETVNRRYLAELSDTQLADQLRPFLADVYENLLFQAEWLVQLTAVIRHQLNKLEDGIELAEWALSDTFDNRFAATTALASPNLRPLLTQLIAEISTLVLLDEQTAHHILAHLPHHTPETAVALASILTGNPHEMPLPTVMGLLGKQRVLNRLAAALRLF